MTSKWFEFEHSRLGLLRFWLLPWIIYVVAALSLPTIHVGRVASTQVWSVMFTLGELFVPVTMVFMGFFIREPGESGKLIALTKERYRATRMCILLFHFLMLAVFLVLVVFADYSAQPDTHYETLEGRCEFFSKLGLYISLAFIFPVRGLFQRA